MVGRHPGSSLTGQRIHASEEAAVGRPRGAGAVGATAQIEPHPVPSQGPSLPIAIGAASLHTR